MDKRKKSEFRFFVGLAAVAIASVGIMVSYHEGLFTATPQEIVQQLNDFQRCDIKVFTTTVSGLELNPTRQFAGQPKYINTKAEKEVELLQCELSPQQKITADTIEKAEKLEESITKKVWMLPNHLLEDVKQLLVEQNESKSKQELNDRIKSVKTEYTDILTQDKKMKI